MGFNIGKLLSLGGAAVGGFFGGPAGAAAGFQLGSLVSGEEEKAATIGRQTQPGPITPAAFTPAAFSGATFPSFRAPSVGPTRASFAGIGRAVGTGLLGLGVGQMFGGSKNGGSPISQILAKARAATGGPVTRNRLIDAAKVCGLEVAADTFGLDVREVCMVVVKGRTRRRRGVSAADIRRTKRTINFASKIRKDLKALAR